MANKKIPRTEIKMYIAELLCEHNKKKPLENISLDEMQNFLKNKLIDRGVSRNIVLEAKKLAIKECLRISITLMSPKNEELQGKLTDKFKENGLEQGIVIDLFHDEKLIDALGRTAAEFFEINVEDGDTVVLSCGTTVKSMIEKINVDRGYKNLKVISSIVLCVDSFQTISPSVLIHTFTHKFKGVEGIAYQIPAILAEEFEPKNLYNILKDNVFNRALDADFYFLGIGSLSKDHERGFTAGFNTLINKLNCYNEFREGGCLGEISYWPITDRLYKGLPWLMGYARKIKNKQRNIWKYFKSVYTIDFDEIIKRKTEGTIKGKVVAVAGGAKKEKAINACLKINNLIQILITDSKTAEKILKLN